MSRISELLNVEYPIIQGAIGVIGNPKLVASVSEAGGFGLLATAFATDVEFVRDQVRSTRAITMKPFGANLFTMNSMSLDFAAVLVEEGINAVTVSGENPEPLIPFLREHGIKVLAVVKTVESALKAESLGADAVVAEGNESGGIQEFSAASTMVLVPAVADAVKVPVIAAGGIGDSRGYRAALALGAEGVQVGTRFIATKECIAHDNYKHLIVNANDQDTMLINLGTFQVRVLRTVLTDRIEDAEEALHYFGDRALEDSWLKGNLDGGLLPAGQIAGLVNKILSARDVIRQMTASNV